jgi:uncharacterized hydrophobic protein (TIGR00271 family)
VEQETGELFLTFLKLQTGGDTNLIYRKMAFKIFVTVHEEDVEDVVTHLRANLNVKIISNIKTTSEQAVISFRCSDDRLSEILDSLTTDKGIGSDRGIIDVIHIATTRPFLWGESGESKEKKSEIIKFAARKQLTEQIYVQVYEESKCTIDYTLYCLVGAILAGIGLATDNAVTIVASMLVSPLMGPIMGMTLGTIMRSKFLIRNALISEAVGIAIVFITGALLGLIFSPFGNEKALKFPTFQMLDRGRVDSIVFGICIAFVSGIGIALSVSHGAVNSLVGVAISSSLLPPITNSGMLLTYGLIHPYVTHVTLRSDSTTTAQNYNVSDFVVMSAISFSIFVLNIIFIYVTGLVMFKIKQMAPLKNEVNAPQWKDFKNLAPVENHIRTKSLLFTSIPDSEEDGALPPHLSRSRSAYSVKLRQYNAMKRSATQVEDLDASTDSPRSQLTVPEQRFSI